MPLIPGRGRLDLRLAWAIQPGYTEKPPQPSARRRRSPFCPVTVVGKHFSVSATINFRHFTEVEFACVYDKVRVFF